MSTETANVTCLFQEVLEDLYLREEATAPRCGHTGSCNMSRSSVKNRMKDNYRWWYLLLTLSPHSDWESNKCQENKRCSRGFPRIFPREAQENPWHVGGTRTERQHHKTQLKHREHMKDFTHCETWTMRFGYHAQKDLCSFEFLKKTSHVLYIVGN